MPTNPFPGWIGILDGSESFRVLFACARTIAVAKRMLAALLQAGGEAEDFVLESAGGCGRSLTSLRLAFGQRAGLVDDQGVDFLQGLERFGVFDEHSGVGAAAGADHDRHRRSETEGAGTGDDEHGDRIDQRVRQARLRTESEPRDEGDDGNGDDCRNEPRGDAIGEALDRRAAALGLSDQLDDLGEQGFGADALGSHDEGSGAVDGRADDFALGSFSTGIDSPVIIDSSMELRPSRTTPSTGTFSPGRTRR